MSVPARDLLNGLQNCSCVLRLSVKSCLLGALLYMNFAEETVVKPGFEAVLPPRFKRRRDFYTKQPFEASVTLQERARPYGGELAIENS